MENNELYDAVSKAFCIDETKEHFKKITEVLEDESLSLEQIKALVKEEQEELEHIYGHDDKEQSNR